jgi:hypothetical protein
MVGVSKSLTRAVGGRGRVGAAKRKRKFLQNSSDKNFVACHTKVGVSISPTYNLKRPEGDVVYEHGRQDILCVAFCADNNKIAISLLGVIFK